MDEQDKRLWKATAYQAGIGKLKIISMVSGVSMDVLKHYVKTGEIPLADKMALQVCAAGD